MDAQELTQRYITIWNEADAVLRAEQVSALFAPEARYVDPQVDVSGTKAISEMIGQVQAQFVGATFRVTGSPDGHHQQLRFSWELGQEGDSPAPIAGFDVAVMDEHGRIELVLGFLDRVSA
ncbi:MAG: nuclear transport factor 2 family protein [Microbacterium enclense]